MVRFPTVARRLLQDPGENQPHRDPSVWQDVFVPVLHNKTEAAVLTSQMILPDERSG